MQSKDRSYLRSQAQTLDPIVMVGKNGESEAVRLALVEALEFHELVKVRFQTLKDQVKQISESLAISTNSTLVATTGFTAVFYKQNPNPQKRIYRLPSRY